MKALRCLLLFIALMAATAGAVARERTNRNLCHWAENTIFLSGEGGVSVLAATGMEQVEITIQHYKTKPL